LIFIRLPRVNFPRSEIEGEGINEEGGKKKGMKVLKRER
jgi:hypothetical protein